MSRQLPRPIRPEPVRPEWTRSSTDTVVAYIAGVMTGVVATGCLLWLAVVVA